MILDVFLEKHDEITFQSLRFKTENVQNFPALSDYKGTITNDNIGRVHLPTPHTGPVSLHQRATKYHSSTIAIQVNDLHNILKEEKKAASIILSDGGPDYSPSNVVNSSFYFRLFQELNFDLLSVSTYATRYSAHNPIEHASSPLSNLLAGVVFSPKLERVILNHRVIREIFLQTRSKEKSMLCLTKQYLILLIAGKTQSLMDIPSE